MNNVITLKDYKPKDKFISAKDVKKIFNGGISQATLANWVNKKFISRYKIGGLVFYKESEILTLIERSQQWQA